MTDRTCPTCNYVFSFPSRLKLHFETVIHCKKTIDEINNYFSSINLDTEFICIKCNYVFAQKSSYNRHLKNSKCYNANEETLIISKQNLQVLIKEEAKKILNDKKNNSLIISNNNNLTNSNNTVNNTINNITNNNTIIQHINPFGFEDVRTIPISEMKMILNSGNEAGIHIIKAIYNKIENKNFYKPNISRSEIACLNQEFKLTIYKSREFCDALFDKCIAFLHHMLFLCKNEYTTINIKYIYDNIEFIESTMRTEIYEKKLQNIIETEFRNNNLDTKDRIKKFIKEIKDNVETKENSLLQIKNTTTLKEDKINEYKISITNLELNNLFGDPKIILGLRKNELMLNLRISRFEESIFYNFWMDRIKNIKKYVMSNKKSTIGDIINLTKEETKIIAMLEIVNKRVEKDRSSDIIDLNINEEFRLADIDTLEEVDERDRHRLNNTNIINNIDTIVSG